MKIQSHLAIQTVSCSQIFRSSSNIFETILFRCSTICHRTTTCMNTTLTCGVSGWNKGYRVHVHFPKNFVDDVFLCMLMFTGVYLENEGLYHFIARAMPFAFSAPLPFKKSRQVLNQILLLLARPKIFCFIQNNI